MNICFAQQAFYRHARLGLAILASCMYATLNHAVDLSYLSNNEFILINKTETNIYYTYKDAFVPGTDTKTALPQVDDFKKAANKLEDNHLKAIGTLQTKADSIFILLVSTDFKGQEPVAVYYFQNQNKPRRVFLEVVMAPNSPNWDTLQVNPLPKRTIGDPGTLCINIPGTQRYIDEDVIPSKDAQGKDAKAGVCLDLANNIQTNQLDSKQDIKGDYTTPVTQKRFVDYAHKMKWISEI